MTAIVVMFAVGVPLATLLVALIYWLAGKASGIDAGDPPSTGRAFAAWLGACLIALWAWWGDGSPFSWLFARFAAAALGAVIVYQIAAWRYRRQQHADSDVFN